MPLCAVVICLYEFTSLVFLFQKPNDNKEQVIKKRKKKEVNNLEEKNLKNNRVQKQGWESRQSTITVSANVFGRPISVSEVIFELILIEKINEWLSTSWAS